MPKFEQQNFGNKIRRSKWKKIEVKSFKKHKRQNVNMAKEEG